MFSVYGRMTALPGRRDELIGWLLDGFRAGGEWPNRVSVLKCEVHPPYTVAEAKDDLEALGFTVEIDTQHFSCVIGRRP